MSFFGVVAAPVVGTTNRYTLPLSLAAGQHPVNCGRVKMAHWITSVAAKCIVDSGFRCRCSNAHGRQSASQHDTNGMN